MIYRWLADGVAVVHALFVIFVVAGGFLVLRWPRVAWAHVPAALWGALIEFTGWICPLTPLEKVLRVHAGEAGFSGGFIQHYVVGALYPRGLTPGLRWTLGAIVVLINVTVYSYILMRWRRRSA